MFSFRVQHTKNSFSHFFSPLKEIQLKNVSDAIKFTWQQRRSWNKACAQNVSRTRYLVMTKRTKTWRSLIAIRNLPTNFWENSPANPRCQAQKKKNCQTPHLTTSTKFILNKLKSFCKYLINSISKPHQDITSQHFHLMSFSSLSIVSKE